MMNADPITTLVKLAAENQNPHRLITLVAADGELLHTIKKLCTQPLNPTSRNWVRISELCLANKITPEQFQESLQLVARILGLVEYEENYYQILGIDPSATREEIKQAFRRLSLSCHPDTNPDDPGAAERFRTLHRAYQALSDDRLRRQYDRHLNAPAWSEKSDGVPEKPARSSLWKWKRTWQIGALVAALLIAVFVVDYQEWQAERYYSSKSKKVAPTAAKKDAQQPAETPAATTQTAVENQRREIDKLRVAALNSKPEPAPTPPSPAPEPKQESPGPEPTKPKAPSKEAEPKPQVSAELPKEKSSPPVPEAKPEKTPTVEKAAPTVVAASEPMKNKAPSDGQKQQIVAEPAKEKSVTQHSAPSEPTVIRSKAPSKEPEPKQTLIAEAPKEKSSAPVREAKSEKTPAVEKAAPTVPAPSEPAKNKAVPDEPKRQIVAAPPPDPVRVQKAEVKPPTPVVAGQESKETGKVSEQDMERRIRSFLAGYAQTYQQMNAAALLAFFEKDALENGQPIRDLVPVYRENFQKAEMLSYRIDLRKWTESGEGVQVDGTFRLRVKFRGEEDPVESAGSIQLALVRKGDQFRVQRLDYRFRNVE